MTKKAYREKCISCIKHQDHRNTQRPDIYYYENFYAKKIKEYFKKNGVKSLETVYSKRTKTTSICSFLSSGRFCYNYFRKFMNESGDEFIKFEHPLYNDLPSAHLYPTKMDAANPNAGNYYECKCDEITASKHDLLSVSYKEKSKLFQEFGINNIKLTEPKIDKNGHEHVHIMFPASELVDFGCLSEEYPKYKDCLYNELCFDLKQCICHLIALANTEGPRNLIYIVFVPDKNNLDYYPALMEKEMKCIKNSKKIQNFLKTHNISFSWEFVSIGDVEDINYFETYLNK